MFFVSSDVLHSYTKNYRVNPHILAEDEKSATSFFERIHENHMVFMDSRLADPSGGAASPVLEGGVLGAAAFPHEYHSG